MSTRATRRDKQYFKDLSPKQLEAVVEGLDIVLDNRLHKDDLSVIDVRPVYLLLEKAKEELAAKKAEPQPNGVES